jgi:hypothetical protein
MRVSIKKRDDPRNHTKGTRNITNKKESFSCGFVLLRVISWIVMIFQHLLKIKMHQYQTIRCL